VVCRNQRGEHLCAGKAAQAQKEKRQVRLSLWISTLENAILFFHSSKAVVVEKL
jgi:hypothetical protein